MKKNKKEAQQETKKETKKEAQQDKKKTDSQKTYTAMIGDMVWLLSRSEHHGYMFLKDLEWYLFPPLMLNQFRIYRSSNKAPAGLILWAYVDDETSKRLGLGQMKLKPTEWKKGEELWIIDIISPFGKGEDMLKDLDSSIFLGKKYKYLKNNDGKIEVIEAKGELAEIKADEELEEK